MLCCAVLLIILKEKRGASCCLSYSGSHRLRLLPKTTSDCAVFSTLIFPATVSVLVASSPTMKSTDQNVPKRNWNVGSNALSIPLGAMLIWWCVLSPQVLIFRRAWRRESNVKRGSTGKVSGVTVLSGWRTALLARCRANLRCCIIYLRARSFVCDSSVAFLPYLKMQPLLRANPRRYLHFASCHSVPTALPMRALYCEYSYHERKPKSTWFFFVCSLSNFSLSLLFPSGLD